MPEFNREHRYWLIKRKHLRPEQDEFCRQFIGRLRHEGVPDTEAVCVEAHWPIYDQTWDAVQRYAEGRPQRSEEFEARIAQLERDLRDVRVYAGDHLPAREGLVVIDKLERALRPEKHTAQERPAVWRSEQQNAQEDA